LSQQLEELAAANAALEAQLAAMAALNAQVAQATAVQLAGFQSQVGQITAALTAIVAGLEELGAANQAIGALAQALAAQINAISAQIAVITANIDSLAGDNDALQALLDSLADSIASVNEEIAKLADQISSENGNQVTLSGIQETNRTLVPSIDYYLDGDFVVKAGSVLTVPAGTAVVAKTAGSKIVIEEGAGIDILGTTASPVYFTKLAEVESWDGIHVYGSANVENVLIQSSTVGIGLLDTPVSTARPENPTVSQGVDITMKYFKAVNAVLEEVTNGILMSSTGHNVDLDKVLSVNSENVITISKVPSSFIIADLVVYNTIPTKSVIKMTAPLDLSSANISNVTIQSTTSYPAILETPTLTGSKVAITGLSTPEAKVMEGESEVVSTDAVAVDGNSFDETATYESSTIDVDEFESSVGAILDNAGTEDPISTGGHHSGGGSNNGGGSEEHHSGGGTHHSGGGSTNG
jgi:prefoldin subunit 5